MKITYEALAGHTVDPDLPAHWTGIREGQSAQDRTAAIMSNVTRDMAQVPNDARSEVLTRGVGEIETAIGRRVIDHSRSHPVDKNLPRHWDGITYGQSPEDREAAILRNIGYDKALRDRGIDAAEFRGGRRSSRSNITPTEALARVAELSHRSPN